jgi:hypothetical protein
LVDPAQLDIFVPLQRSERFPSWAGLAVENHVELRRPEDVSAFAGWLRDHGHAPPGLGHEAVTVLVAVMSDYERDTLLRSA